MLCQWYMVASCRECLEGSCSSLSKNFAYPGTLYLEDLWNAQVSNQLQWVRLIQRLQHPRNLLLPMARLPAMDRLLMARMVTLMAMVTRSMAVKIALMVGQWVGMSLVNATTIGRWPGRLYFIGVVGENGDRGRLMKALFLKDWAFLFFGTLLTAIHSGNLGRRFPTCHCSSIIQHLILAYSSSIFSPLALPPTSTFEGSLEILTSLPSSHFDSHLSNPFHMTFCPKVSDRSKTQWEHPSETPAKPSKPARPAPSASAGSGGTKTATTQSSLPPKGWGYSWCSVTGEMKYNAITFQDYVCLVRFKGHARTAVLWM